MRIHASAHDYYDCAERNAREDALVYHRRAKSVQYHIGGATTARDAEPGALTLFEIMHPALPAPGPRGLERSWWNEHRARHAEPAVLIVGAESALVWRLRLAFKERRHPGEHHDGGTWCASSDDVRRKAQEAHRHTAKSIVEGLGHRAGGHGNTTGRSRAEMLDGRDALAPVNALIRTRTKAPVVIVTDIEPDPAHRGWEIRACENAPLEPYRAARIWSPHAAWQAIEHWLASLARREADSVGVDDVHLARQKGFDQWSFRREPGRQKHHTRRNARRAREPSAPRAP